MSLVNRSPQPLNTSASLSAASSSSNDTVASPGLARHTRDGGFLSQLKKWGVVGAVVTGLVIPATIALQIAGAPSSPSQLNVPTPPAISQPIAPPVDRFDPGPPAVVVLPPVTAPVTDVAPPVVPVSPPVTAPVAPPVTAPVASPVTAPVDVVAPPVAAPITGVAGLLAHAFNDGAVDVAEAKGVIGAAHNVADIRLVVAAFDDSRTSSDARDVFDAFFVRNGVPHGKGAAHVTAQVEGAAARGDLTALRGRLQTAQMLRVELPASSTLPRGGTVWVAPGARAQAFLEVNGQGAFGPIALQVRPSS